MIRSGDARPAPSLSQPDFAGRLEDFGDRPALVNAAGEQVTYRDLAARADAFGADLGPTRRLLMVDIANEIEPIVAYLGALRAGHVVLLSSGGDLSRRIWDVYQPHFLYRRDAERWGLAPGREGPIDLHPDLAVLLSTSGTTGAAKLVRLSGDAVAANARSIAQYLELTADERPITTLPLSYSYGLSVMNSHLSVGACLVLTPDSVIDPGFWTLFEREAATSLAGVPYTYELFDRIGLMQMAPPSLKTLTQAGGRLPPDVVSRYAAWSDDHGMRFFVMYGQTEATARMAYLPPRQAAAHPDCIGVAIPEGRFRLVDEEGAEIEAPDTPGELVYSGPNVMMGYAQEATDLAKGREIQELHTGDLAVRGAGGLYRITGRKSRFSKLFGLRISLDEVEALARRRGFEAAAAGNDQLLALAVDGPAEASELGLALAQELGLPPAVIDVSAAAIPRLPSGKPDYAGILRAAQGRAAAREAGPQSGTVRAAFARAFPKSRIRPEDSFITLGGDSLSYVNLSLDLEVRLGRLPEQWEELSVERLQTLADQAETRPRTFWGLRGVESEVVLRAFAIIAVILTHASTLTVGGGADVLLLLSGYNLARYQRPRLIRGDGLDIVWSFLKRIILPYYGILLIYLVVAQKFDLFSLLLVSNFVGRFASFLEPFWFLELLLQCFVLVALLFAIPAVRRFGDREPWTLGLALLGVSLAVKVAGYAAFHHGALGNRTPDALFYLLALGWCLQLARTRARKLLMTGVVGVLAVLETAGVPGLWFAFPFVANVTHALWLSVAAGLILWAPRMSIPGWSHTAVGAVAGASFYIYLTHGVPVHLLRYEFGVDNGLLILLAALAVGIAAWRVADRAMPSAVSERSSTPV